MRPDWDSTSGSVPDHRTTAQTSSLRLRESSTGSNVLNGGMGSVEAHDPSSTHQSLVRDSCFVSGDFTWRCRQSCQAVRAVARRERGSGKRWRMTNFSQRLGRRRLGSSTLTVRVFPRRVLTTRELSGSTSSTTQYLSTR